MKVKRALSMLCILILLGMSVVSPILIASFPATPVTAQSNLNSVEKAADTSLALGTVFKSCSIISADIGYIGNNQTLVNCIKDVIGILFLLVVLWIVILVSVSMLGGILSSGEKLSDPIAQTRKRIEKSLIGLVLIGAPYLLLSLFTTNLTNTDLLYTKIDDKLIKACFEIRRDESNNVAQTIIQQKIRDNIRVPFITGAQANQTKIIVLGEETTQYAINLKYINSDFCVGKLPLEKYKDVIKNITASGAQERKRAEYASMSRRKAKLAAIIFTPTTKTVEELQAEVAQTYSSCISELPQLAVFCEVVSMAAEVASYSPSDTPAETVERNRWLILTGRLYVIANGDASIGDAVINALIISIERGKLDPSSTKAAVAVANDLITKDAFKTISDPATRDAHLQRVAYVSASIVQLVDNPQVDGRIAANAIGYVSTFVAASPPTNDTEKSFVALKAAVVGNMMRYLINNCSSTSAGPCYSERAILSTSMAALVESLRAYKKDIEAEVVFAVGQQAEIMLDKLSAQAAGDYKITASDYGVAALDLGLFALDTAVSTNQDFDPDGRLTKITRISAEYGRELLVGEINCSQTLFGIKKNVIAVRLYAQGKEDQTQSNEFRAEQSGLYTSGVGRLKASYNGLTTSNTSVIPDEATLIDIMERENLVRPGLAGCNVVQDSRLVTLVVDIAKAALPSNTPSIVSEGIDFVAEGYRVLTGPGSDAVKQDYLALAFVDLGQKAVQYIPTDANGNSVISTIITDTLVLTRSYLGLSIDCKNALEAKRSTPQTSRTTINWNEIYERYNTGRSNETDTSIFRSFDDLDSCEGIKTSVLLDAAMNTIRTIYLFDPNADPRIANLIDPNSQSSVTFLVVQTMRDQQANNLYPQNVAIRVINVGSYLIKNYSAPEDTRLATAVDSVGGQIITLLGYSLERQKQCDLSKAGNGGDSQQCSGLNEFDFSRSLLTVIKDIIQIQGPEKLFFAQVLDTVNSYIDELQNGGLSDTEAGIGLLDVANSGVQSIIVAYSEKQNLTEAEKQNLILAQSISGKGFNLARTYLIGRDVCEERIAETQNRIRKNTLSKDDQIKINTVLGYTLGPAELGVKSFTFADSDISRLEPLFNECKNTIPLQAANAVIDIVVEFVKIPGFPMAEAATLARYLSDIAINPEKLDKFTEYRTGQYVLRLLAATVNQNACTSKTGEVITAEALRSRADSCKTIAGVFGFVDSLAQLYIDGKATNPNFAREFLNLGKSIAMTYKFSDEYTINQVEGLTNKVITLWERSLNGETDIFTEKTVAAEFLNFAGAMIPHALKLDNYSTALIQTWSDVAATALRAPEAIDATVAARATAAFVASKIWQCDQNNGRTKQGAECANDVSADVTVFMGVLSAINLKPVSKDSYLSLCKDAVGNDVCAPQINEQIRVLEQGIAGNNKNAYRQANSYLALNKGGPDIRVTPADLGSSSFIFSGEQTTKLQGSINVCEAVGAPRMIENPRTEGEAAKNDPVLARYDNYDYSEVPNNQCLRNPMIQLTSSLSLNLDTLIKSVLYGVSKQYGSIGIGENKIVTILTKVASEIDYNRVVSGDNSTISRTLTRNISYVLKSLPIEDITGTAAASVIRIVGDLPWETIIYNPLALGGNECLPPKQTTPDNSPVVYNDFKRETIQVKATNTELAADQGPLLIGVDTPTKSGLAPACTSSLVTGILARIDFGILFTSLGGRSETGLFINQVVGVLDRMDFNCPLGTRLANGSCDQSFGSVAKSVFRILGVLDFGLITDAKTAKFIKTFTSEFPVDVFTTGFNLGQMDNFVNVTALVAEQFGVDEATITTFKQTYNILTEVLKIVGEVIRTIDTILKYLQIVVNALGTLSAAGIPLIPASVLTSLKTFIDSARALIAQIRSITDTFDQLKKVDLPPAKPATVTWEPFEWSIIASTSTHQKPFAVMQNVAYTM